MPDEGNGRESRADEVRAQRRRRQDGELTAEKRLPIPPEIAERLEREGLHPRWVNDENNRMHRFTVQDDYDPVEGVEPVPVGTDKDGKPILAHLLAKPKRFFQEDQEKADEKRREVEKALLRSPDAAAQAAAGANPNNPTVRPHGSTFVDPASKINRGNQIIEG